MKRLQLRRITSVALSAMVGGLLIGPVTAVTASAANSTVIDVLTINDFHGRIEAAAPSAGAAVLAGLAKQMRAANPNTIVASAGDNVGASTFVSSVANDQPTIDSLNAVGVDVSTFGNHEFDQGRSDVDNRLAKQFNFPLVSANIVDKTTGTYAYSPYYIKTLDGVRVAFVGATTEDIPGLVSPAGISTLTFNPIASSVNTVADQLKDGNATNGEADVVVMLVHEGAAAATEASVLGDTAFGSLVKQTAGHVDAIVSGHTHQAYSHGYTTSTGKVVPVVEAGQYGEKYGHLTITADSTTHQLTSITSEVKALVGAAPADATVAAIVKTAVDNSAALGAKSVGTITSNITRAVQPAGTENRGGESTLSNLLADVDKWAAKDLGAEIGLHNPGGTRADLTYASSGAGDADGNITYKEASAVQPFANTLVTLDLTGAQLKAVLEEQWQPAGLSRPFLKLGVSEELNYTYDPNAASGSHITAMYLNGVRITDAQVIKVATNAFLASGGDQFFTFAKGANTRDSGRIDLQSFVSYLEANSPVSPDYAQRAVGVIASAPANGTAYVAGETVTVKVSSMLYTKAAPSTGDAVITLGGKTVATAALSSTITSSYDEQGQATLTFTIPDGLTGTQTATISGPGGTSVPLTLTIAAASTTLRPIGCSTPKTFVAQGEDATVLKVKQYVEGQGVNTPGATYTALGGAWAGNGFTKRYNAIGYNNRDNYIYGLADAESGSVDLVKVGDQGVVQVVGEVKGLPLDHAFRNNGTFLNGVYYFSTESTKVIYSLDLNTLQATAITLSQTWEASDFVQIEGYLWGIFGSDMYRLDVRNGQVDIFNIGNLLGGSTFGAGGAVFRYNNADFGVVSSDIDVESQIHITNPGSSNPSFSLVGQAQAPTSGRNDGTSCIDR